MREIIFRGKAIDSGKWVYGDLVHNAIFHCGKFADAIYEEGNVIKVNPETVGQYTGLKDKHDNKIFEGDIVRVYDWTSAYASEYSGEVTMYRGTWVVEHERYGITSYTKLCFDDFAGRKTEVVGNIYDKNEGE